MKIEYFIAGVTVYFFFSLLKSLIISIKMEGWKNKYQFKPHEIL